MSANDRWYWVPDAANTQPAYAPALVAFLPATGAEQIGWVPLAPGEQYAPAFYDTNWQPHYYNGNYNAPERVVNLGVPGGVTVVSLNDFGRPFDGDRVERFDPRAFDGVRPLGDPLSHAMLRRMSLTRANERRGFKLPPGLARKLDDTRVYASAPPPPRFRGGRDDFARRFRVEAVPEKQKREKLKFKDERQEPAQASAPARRFEEVRGRGRDSKREQKAEQRAARGRDSFTQPLRPERAEGERVSGRAEERARGERAAQQRQAQQAQAAFERQRGNEEQRQRRFEAQRQAEGQRQAQRQAAQQQHEQQRAQRAQQQQEMMRARQSQQQQRRAERPQHQQQRPAAQVPPGQSRKQQGGPPSGGGGAGGGKGQGRGGGGGGGKGKGKH